MTTEPESLEAWLATRPPVVQDLARRFPPGTVMQTNQGRAWVIAYCDDGGIELTHIDPSTNYEQAVAERFYVCPSCIR